MTQIADCKLTNCGLGVARVYETDSKGDQPYKWSTKAATWQEALANALDRALTKWDAQSTGDEEKDGRALFVIAPQDNEAELKLAQDQVENWDEDALIDFAVEDLCRGYEGNSTDFQQEYHEWHSDSLSEVVDGKLE